VPPSGAHGASRPGSPSDQAKLSAKNMPLVPTADIPRHRIKEEPELAETAGLINKIGHVFHKYRRPIAAVAMGALRLPLMATPAYGADAEDIDLDANHTAAGIANHAVNADVARSVLFGGPTPGAKPITDGAYHSLLEGLDHPKLANVKTAMSEGRLRLLTDIPAANGTRTIVVGHNDNPQAADANTPNIATKIALSKDGTIKSIAEEKLVHVWAYESDPSSPGGLQPISIGHFSLDAEGKISTLSGERIRIEMPKEIATKVDDISLTEVTEKVRSNFPTHITLNKDGKFAFSEESPLTGATTAFYSAAKVIEEADRWAGYQLSWGKDGTLVMKPYEFVTDFFNAYYNRADGSLVLGALGSVDAETGKIGGFTGTPAGYDNPVENMMLDGAKSRDIVSHEAGHAVLDALKPGMKHGMGIAYHEGFADMINFLSALEDPDVIARVLTETNGDLSKPHEASRMAEVIGHTTHKHNNHAHDDDHDYVRLTKNNTRVEDAGLTRDDNGIPGLGIAPSRDPHKIGQVLSGAGHDAFVNIYEKELQKGKSPEEAIAIARETMGTILVRSTRFIGEHQTSMRDAAIAMLRVDDMNYGKEYRAELVKAFEERGLIDAGENIDELINARSKPLPNFTLSKDVTDHQDILDRLDEYEMNYVNSLPDDVDDPVPGLLRHNAYVPSWEYIKKSDLSVHSDVTAEDGVRMIRLSYEKEETDLMGNKSTERYFLSTVFGKSGKLIDVHSDRAVENSM